MPFECPAHVQLGDEAPDPRAAGSPPDRLPGNLAMARLHGRRVLEFVGGRVNLQSSWRGLGDLQC